MINRRNFLQSTTGIGVSCILPKIPVPPVANFHLIRTDTLASWSVTDPVEWSFRNADQPIPARAADRLGKLTNEDDQRVIRLVVRRCGLNLVEIKSNQVTVHYWSDQLADLRPFFKASELASPDVQATLINRKTEVTQRSLGKRPTQGRRVGKSRWAFDAKTYSFFAVRLCRGGESASKSVRQQGFKDFEQEDWDCWEVNI
jgi:hypothetical protein